MNEIKFHVKEKKSNLDLIFLDFLQNKVFSKGRPETLTKIIVENDIEINIGTWLEISASIVNDVILEFTESVVFTSPYNEENEELAPNLTFEDEGESLFIQNCIFNGNCEINVNASRLNFYKSSFNELYISDSLKKDITISRSNFFENVSLYHDDLNAIRIVNSSFEGSLEIEFGGENLILLNNNYGELSLINLYNIKLFELSNSIQVNLPKLNLQNIKILSGNRDDIIFSDLNIGNLIIGNFKNLSEDLLFSNITIYGHFSVNNTNFGNAVFNRFILTDSCKFFIKDTIISKIIFNSIKLPDRIEITCKLIGESLNTYDLQDNFRQLKLLMDNNSNHTAANLYFGKEMHYFGKTLTWRKHFFNKGLHVINGIISNYGNSWIRALIILLCFSSLGAIFDYIYSSSSGRIIMREDYIQYLNPVFILPKEIHGIFISYNFTEQFFFILFKGFYAIIIYQLIVAARRTTKR